MTTVNEYDMPFKKNLAKLTAKKSSNITLVGRANETVKPFHKQYQCCSYDKEHQHVKAGN